MQDGLVAPSSLHLPSDLRQGPVCGVLAVSVAVGVPFTRVWILIGERKSRRWRGVTNHSDRARALDFFGVRYHHAPLGRGDRVRLSTFVSTRLRYGVTYIIRTGGHVQVVRDGWVLDQSGASPVHRFWGRNKIVTSVITIAHT